MKRVSPREGERLTQLRAQLGDRTLRTLLTSEDRRLMRPERFENLIAGRGKLSESERERLKLVGSNSQKLKNLQKKSQNRRDFQTNRALRSWLLHGKEKEVRYADQDAPEKEDQMKAIKALRFLGVDPADGKFYVKKGSK